MKILQFGSIIVLIISVIGFILWRFMVPFPDWSVRVIGIFMLISIFSVVFSTVKIAMNKK